MIRLAHFSRHARRRLGQRCRMSSGELAEILDRRLAVNTGRKPGFEKVHLLFFSPRDDAYFVAIQDRLAGTVVTVLPLDYHEQLAWPVTDEQRAEARRLIDAHAARRWSRAARRAATAAGAVVPGAGRARAPVL
jgi:hypothetical protein